MYAYYIWRVRYLADFEFPAIKRGFHLAFDLNLLVHTPINVHLPMYLIWRMDTTAKGAKKNTSQYVVHTEYYNPFLLRVA